MRKRQPKHEKQLKSIEDAAPVEVIRRIKITNHGAADFLDSEVLAALIRNRHQESAGVVNEATVVLNRRIQARVAMRLRGTTWAGMAGRSNTVIEDTIDYVWDALLDGEGLSNSEVYFVVFVRDRIDDYMRHLLSQKNSMESIDARTVADDDGGSIPFIDTVEADDAETPEETLMRTRQTAAVRGKLISLPRTEREAFYLRIECRYEWKKVAEFIGCSIPTARQYLKRSLKKLQGAME
ncbi:MAG: sigma-70 family RNA polymerase sigma factor [Rhodobacteraceae bacterium]|nr:sigma-70 family RNA polymerase sigma factor [Paracoccaceae bacterium]